MPEELDPTQTGEDDPQDLQEFWQDFWNWRKPGVPIKVTVPDPEWDDPFCDEC